MKLHIDIDCFFVSAHRINNPHFNNIPLAVGGRSNLSIFDTKKEVRELSCVDGAFTSSILSSNGNKTFEEYFVDKKYVDTNTNKVTYNKIRGIITTSSYEARAYGVKTAMSVAEALRYCPTLTVLPPNYPLYHKLSSDLKNLLQKHIPSIEQFSIDEFFGDITGWIKDEDVYSFATNLKQIIFDEIKIPVSIGVSQTKWISKLCTNAAKPYGVKVIYANEINDFIQDIKIEAFPGIGKGYQKRLKSYNIKTLGDIKNNKDVFLPWGKNGLQLYNRVCGIDNEPISLAKNKKSIGLGRTFDPIRNTEEIKRRITILCRHLSFLAYKGKHNPLTYSLQIRYEYGTKNKDYINTHRLFNEQLFKNEVIKLFNKIDTHPTHNIIQVNITLSNFQENTLTTLDLFTHDEDTKLGKVMDSLQKLRDKFGVDIIKSGGEM